MMYSSQHHLPAALTIILFSILCITLIPHTHAKTRLHKGPPKGQPERILYGYTKTSPSPSDRSGGPPGGSPPHIVDFAIHITHDIVMWDELVKDGISMESCSFKSGSRFSHMKLSGIKLDFTDFGVGVIFAVEKGDYELNCRKPLRPVPGIDKSDNILFFKIIRATTLGPHTVLLKLKLVPGRYVVPEVDMTMHEASSAAADQDDFAIYDDDVLPDSTEMAIRPLLANDTLPTVDRFTQFKKTIKIAGGATFDVNAGVKVKFASFKVLRLRSLEFRWEQSSDAFLRASLNVKFPLRKSAYGEISRFYIPRLSFKAGIPVVGKLQAGAFVALNYVVELDTNVKLRAMINAKYKRREVVTARISSPRYSAVNKLAFGSGATGSGSVVVASSGSVNADGFAGVRPVIGVGLTYTTTRVTLKGFKLRTEKESKSVDGNVGARVGAKLAVDYMKRPFRPFFGKKLNPICSSCHSLRANLRFVGKSLSAQLVVAEEVKAEKLIVASLFNLDVGTLCLMKKTCK